MNKSLIPLNKRSEERSQDANAGFGRTSMRDFCQRVRESHAVAFLTRAFRAKEQVSPEPSAESRQSRPACNGQEGSDVIRDKAYWDNRLSKCWSDFKTYVLNLLDRVNAPFDLGEMPRPQQAGEKKAFQIHFSPLVGSDENYILDENGNRIRFFDVNISKDFNTNKVPVIELKTYVKSGADIKVENGIMFINGIMVRPDALLPFLSLIKLTNTFKIYSDWNTCSKNHTPIFFHHLRECPACEALEALHKLADEAMVLKAENDEFNEHYGISKTTDESGHLKIGDEDQSKVRSSKSEVFDERDGFEN